MQQQLATLLTFNSLAPPHTPEAAPDQEVRTCATGKHAHASCIDSGS